MSTRESRLAFGENLEGLTERQTKLVADNYQHLIRYANYKLNSATHAVDLVHDTLLSAFNQLETFSNKSTERTWLTAILKNKIYRYLKRNSLFTYQGHDELNKMSCNANHGSLIHDFNQPMISKEFLNFLCKGVQQLTEPARSVFIARYIYNKSSEKICGDFDLSSNNYWVICHRSRDFIKRSLEQFGYTG
jgi:RNA polymerase sigma factor (sigma-70 family)